MKKIIFKDVGYFIIAIILLFIVGKLYQYSVNSNITIDDSKLQKLEKNDSLLSKKLKDTVNFYSKKIHNRDSIISLQNNKIKVEKKTFYVAVDNYNNDTIKTSECDSLRDSAIRLITLQSKQIDSLNQQYKETKLIIPLLQNSITRKDSIIEEANSNIKTLILKNKRTWFEKNSKWLTLVIGFTGGLLLR